MSSGRHTIELTSVLNGVESARSSPLVVRMTSAVAITSRTVSDTSTSTAMACAPSSDACYTVSVVAEDIGAPSNLTQVPGQRLLFVEDGAHVRVIENGLLLADAALSFSPSSRIVGLAVDPNFERTRLVFVAWTEAERDGRFSLTITRYREGNNVLGEGARLVSGLAIPDGAIVPLAVDNGGLLYVALPASSTAAQGQIEPPFGGAILRFDLDGLTPRGNPRLSPVIASGYWQPTTLAVDGTNQRVWLGGRSATGAWSLASFSTTRLDAERWPVQPAILNSAASNAVLRLSPLSNAAAAQAGPALALSRPGDRPLMALAADAALLVGAIAQNGLSTSLETLPMDDLPMAVASAQGGLWYVAALSNRGSGKILLLQPKR
jgi:hypothetical protein